MDVGSKYSILSPLPYAVGNAAEELLFALMRARRLRRRLLILTMPNWTRANGYSTDSAILRVLGAPEILDTPAPIKKMLEVLVAILFLPTRSFSRAMYWTTGQRLVEALNYPRLGVHRLWQTSENYVSEDAKFWKKEFREFEPPKIPEELIRDCRKKIESLGVNEGDWFVCLHVREGGYRGDHGRRDYRNASIENYLGGIRRITERGGWVIRLGDSSMRPLPEKLNRVIDYPFASIRSGDMDLFLISQCRFYIGMLSGPWDLAELFKKPKLGINIYDCSVGLAFNEGDRLVLKHAYSHRNNRKLNLQEFLSADTDLHNIYGEVSNKYSLIENTAEEIETAIENFCELIDSRSFAPSSEQTAISAFWRHHALDRIDLGTYFLGMPAHQRVAECERFKAKTEMANLFLDPTYIEENWNLQE